MSKESIHIALSNARRAQQASEYALAVLLLKLWQSRQYTERGHSSVVQYAEVELDLSPRQTQEFISLARRLRALPTLDATFADGGLGWTKAREVAKIATPETEAAWVERARHVTSRELEALIARSRAGEAPPEPGAMSPSDAVPRRLRLTYELDSADAEIVQWALRLLRLSGEHGDETSAGDLLVEMARRFLGSVEREAAEAGAGAASDAAGAGPDAAGANRRIALPPQPAGEGPDAAGANRRTALPPQPAGEARYRVVLHTCANCQKNPHVRDLGVDAATAAMADCDSERVELTGLDGPDGPNGPNAAPGRLTHLVPPAVRRRVIHRHGDQCAVPYCRHRQFLDIHHIVPRSVGETHDEFGLLPLCPMHHRAIHEGTLLLYGDARGIRFLHPDGQPFGPGAEPTGLHDDAPDALDRLRAAIDGPFGATVPVAAARAGLSRGRAAHGLNVLHAEGQAVQAPLGEWYRVDRVLPVVGARAG